MRYLSATMRILTSVLLACLLLTVSACSWLPEEEDPTRGWSASRIYNEAHTALQKEDYETAVKYFELLEARYPFGRYAQQAQLEIAYTYYKYNEPDSAIAAAERFIRLHPRHPHVDYAYYLKGLVNFNRDSSFLERIFPQDPSTRDPGSTRQAFFDFVELVKRFPDSKYAEDARKRSLYLRNNLAHHEVHVANYYMRRQAYVAAVNRAKYVLEHYDQATATPDALVVMIQAYEKLDMQELAQDARRVLSLNYPDHLGKVIQKEKPWWDI